ncbi:hypothetical protein ACQP2U_34265 [Nocardia sp. CA-084685]|uniref:hypothetical protein n=1 Tax=Nocardia sp. CA-084685 TaxID=3239970 RepID=UPI003D98B3E0
MSPTYTVMRPVDAKWTGAGASQMNHVTGLGKYECADQLAKMLGEKAIGGDGDIDSALAEHIEVVNLIRDTIKVSVQRISEQEQQNAQSTAGIQIQ